MKNIFMRLILRIFTITLVAGIISCNQDSNQTTTASSSGDTTAVAGGQENVVDNVSTKDIVKVAVSSKDHTTLVKALKQADLVTSLANAGPFTVFAPTNDAFNKLPAGTLDDLMKDNKKDNLRNILQYHVFLSALKPESLTDGQVLNMVNGDNLTIHVANGKISLNNGVNVVTTIPASNGMIYVVDGVLLPPASAAK
jgi:uncharacterized surface protein with fasciclin (FAS1) repeats